MEISDYTILPSPYQFALTKKINFKEQSRSLKTTINSHNIPQFPSQVHCDDCVEFEMKSFLLWIHAGEHCHFQWMVIVFFYYWQYSLNGSLNLGLIKYSHGCFNLTLVSQRSENHFLVNKRTQTEVNWYIPNILSVHKDCLDWEFDYFSYSFTI